MNPEISALLAEQQKQIDSLASRYKNEEIKLIAAGLIAAANEIISKRRELQNSKQPKDLQLDTDVGSELSRYLAFIQSTLNKIDALALEISTMPELIQQTDFTDSDTRNETINLIVMNEGEYEKIEREIKQWEKTTGALQNNNTVQPLFKSLKEMTSQLLMKEISVVRKTVEEHKASYDAEFEQTKVEAVEADLNAIGVVFEKEDPTPPEAVGKTLNIIGDGFETQDPTPPKVEVKLLVNDGGLELVFSELDETMKVVVADITLDEATKEDDQPTLFNNDRLAIQTIMQKYIDSRSGFSIKGLGRDKGLTDKKTALANKLFLGALSGNLEDIRAHIETAKNDPLYFQAKNRSFFIRTTSHFELAIKAVEKIIENYAKEPQIEAVATVSPKH